MRPTPLALAALTLALIAGACGSNDSTARGATTTNGDTGRTVQIEMRDIAYSPDRVTVEPGETVRFVFTNTGDVAHDAFIGDAAAQDDHEMEMIGEGGGHGMNDSGAITVEPGQTGEITHTFAAGDDVLIGCHQSGHYEAGMRLTIDV